MADNKDKQSGVNISGSNVQGGIVGIGGQQTVHGAVTITMGDLTATINVMSGADQTEKEQLQQWIAELEAALKAAPAERENDAQNVAKRAKELVEEAGEPEPDQEAVAAKANLLKKAAENVKEAMPVVLAIATNIVGYFLKQQ